MKNIIFKAIPFDKKTLTLALESGVDAILTEEEQVENVLALGRVHVLTPKDMPQIILREKKDEENAVARLKAGENIVLEKSWEIIPVENILAQSETLALEVENLERARLAAGVLERGASSLVILPEAATELKKIVHEIKLAQEPLNLQTAVVSEILPAGLGHRVCVDTISVLKKGEGMLVGNSSAFQFLVHAETESNPYVAARPFRINAGAVHAYCSMPGDKTSYLEELTAGSEVLIVNGKGKTRIATVGRVKTEIRPMLLITATIKNTKDSSENTATGRIFLQNAETIRVLRADGLPLSVVSLKAGDEILVRSDVAGRHFGMRIHEEIQEG